MQKSRLSSRLLSLTAPSLSASARSNSDEVLPELIPLPPIAAPDTTSPEVQRERVLMKLKRNSRISMQRQANNEAKQTFGSARQALKATKQARRNLREASNEVNRMDMETIDQNAANDTRQYYRA